MGTTEPTCMPSSRARRRRHDHLVGTLGIREAAARERDAVERRPLAVEAAAEHRRLRARPQYAGGAGRAARCWGRRRCRRRPVPRAATGRSSRRSPRRRPCCRPRRRTRSRSPSRRRWCAPGTPGTTTACDARPAIAPIATPPTNPIRSTIASRPPQPPRERDAEPIPGDSQTPTSGDAAPSPVSRRVCSRCAGTGQGGQPRDWRRASTTPCGALSAGCRADRWIRVLSVPKCEKAA